MVTLFLTHAEIYPNSFAICNKGYLETTFWRPCLNLYAIMCNIICIILKLGNLVYRWLRLLVHEVFRFWYCYLHFFGYRELPFTFIQMDMNNMQRVDNWCRYFDNVKNFEPLRSVNDVRHCTILFGNNCVRLRRFTITLTLKTYSGVLCFKRPHWLYTCDVTRCKCHIASIVAIHWHSVMYCLRHIFVSRADTAINIKFYQKRTVNQK